MPVCVIGCTLTSQVECPPPLRDIDYDKIFLYKMLLPRHAASLTNFGEIRIGSLGIYRSIESQSRIDRREGRIGFVVDQWSSRYSAVDLESKRRPGLGVLSKMYGFGNYDGPVSVLNSAHIVEAVPCLVFCVTSFPTPSLARKFGEYSPRRRCRLAVNNQSGCCGTKWGKKCCCRARSPLADEGRALAVRIVDVAMFKSLLDEYLGARFGVPESTLAPVCYKERFGADDSSRTSLVPHFTKDPAFAHEMEWRFVWQLPRSGWGVADNYIDLKMPALSRLVRVYRHGAIRRGVPNLLQVEHATDEMNAIVKRATKTFEMKLRPARF